MEPNLSGQIDFEGFMELIFSAEGLSPKTVAKNLFMEFDKNDDGTITFDEFKVMVAELQMTNQSDEDIDLKLRSEFKSVDTDNSKNISVNGELIWIESFFFQVV